MKYVRVLGCYIQDKGDDEFVFKVNGEFAAHYGPFYLFPYKPRKKANAHQDETELWWCIVHPDERERMERILSGTDNPLHDLVHELRYNPNISFEREEAKRDFDSSAKKQKTVV